MKQQVFVIHGGTAFDSYDEYFAYLQSKEISLDRLQGKDWKMTLEDKLGIEFAVYLLKMPNAQNAVYDEWKLWFEKFITFFESDVILIGHSLGAVFLAKYLSEYVVPKKILATLLVAPPFDEDEGRKLPQFAITSSLARLEDQGGKVIIYHSHDDPVVPFTELQKYQEQLPNVVSKVFDDRGHFNMESFPEIVEDIRSISKYKM